MYTQPHAPIEHRLEISSKPMQDTRMGNVECELCESRVMAIGKRQPCAATDVISTLPGRRFAARLRRKKGHSEPTLPHSPCAFNTGSRLGCSNSQHSCTWGPHSPLIPPPSALSRLMDWNITTYGVSIAFSSLLARVSLYSFADDNGAKCAVYDAGIDMPSANLRR